MSLRRAQLRAHGGGPQAGYCIAANAPANFDAVNISMGAGADGLTYTYEKSPARSTSVPMTTC